MRIICLQIVNNLFNRHFHIVTNLSMFCGGSLKVPRIFAADKLTQVIDRCVSLNSVETWRDLLLFAYIALRIPEKSAKKDKSLVSKIKDNVQSFKLSPAPLVKHSKQSLARRIHTKVGDGDIRRAVRLLSLECGLAENTPLTFDSLLEKHPCPSRCSSFPDPPTSEDPCLSVSPDLVLEGIRSFSNGLDSSIDGIRPQHLKDLISKSAGDAGQRLLLAITKLCNFILKGQIIRDICPTFLEPT